jgi:myo-inositol-1(or 4)-monophosphatase
MSAPIATADLAGLAARLELVVREAGQRALADWRRGERTRARIDWKGNSPVTSADLAVDALIADAVAGLGRDGFGPLRYHSEERPEAWDGPQDGLTIVIDPIDGTRSFMEGRDDWCIALGVLAGSEPVIGLLHVPARAAMFAAHRGGGACYQGQPVMLAPEPPSPIRAAGPRGVFEIVARESGLAIQGMPNIAALAHRLVRPLSGDLDLALARPGAHDWDIVAAQCILEEAGGALLGPDGRPPLYTLRGDEHPALLAGSRGLLARMTPSLLTGSLSAAKRG